ncbi:MAG TPA: GDSL-type esterase/lipase family protein [Terracidiphilus sp.]|nr:GDSL-type esterase/lipase family protein [Terracidiphilus sp.]
MSARPINATGPVALAALLAVAAFLPAQSTTQSTAKKHTSAALASKSRAVAHSSHTGATRTTRRRTRVHYYVQRVDPARRAAMVEEIGDRLKQPDNHAIAYSASLGGFFAELAAFQDSRKDGAAPTSTLRVLQWGDSHTAADMFTGEARRLFQDQFGDGGIGFAYAGHPFAGYRIFGSRHGQSTGWKTEGTHFLALGDGELGMGGISISATRAGEWVSLDASCTGLDLEFLAQPGGGSLSLTDNGGDPIQVDTAADAIGPGSFHYACPAGDHHFVLTKEDSSPVTLLGWVATQPGVTWESIGINGAEAPLILRWDQKLFSDYIKDNSPALVVLAYGTNEAASKDWDEDSYRTAFANIVDTIHSYVPESSILVLGPADRSTIQRRAWRTFAGTDKIVAAQRAVCRTHNCAYWDWQQRMGGEGSMQQWAYAGWAQPDHTHFTGDGYRALADALMSDLMTEYKAWEEHNSSGTETAVQGDKNGSGSTNP